jgi:putative Mn2+ efflux pump MntP
MFESEKTCVFWLGLIILGLASIALFSISWYTILTAQPYVNIDYYWKLLVPPVVGSVVFILIGLYMMKSGTKKKEEGKTQLLTQ